MHPKMNTDHTIKDSVQGGWVEAMPARTRPFLRLSRYDRPIGFWLLGLPGWIGLAFATINYGLAWSDLKYAILIAIGAIAMRGAGCTYNDIVDRDLDAKVERTALRPLPAGTVSLKAAWVWLVVQCLIGLIVLAFFPRLAQITALGAIPLVALYPFMKRITFWPQAWLGLTFNWAVLVAYAAKTDNLSMGVNVLQLGLIFWTIGYDTIYACQDVEDDALIGVKSTARLFGKHVRLWVTVFYGLTIMCLMTAIYIEAEPIYILAIFPFAAHLLWQVRRFDPKNAENCLETFKSNQKTALLLVFTLLVVTLTKVL